ncbi:MAG: hypothetical protein I3J02_10600 [Prevotella sp.]|nr:hypothetical protein [Prevotella sp.]
MALSALLIMSCGQTYKSHKVIEDFMKNSMKLEDFDVLSWSNPGIANFVSDSILNVMHRDAEKERLVSGTVKYVPRTERLQFIQVKYAVEKDTITQTFYLDDNNKGVVGFKNN